MVYTKLEENLKSQGRFLQKRQKGSDLKFQILPPKRDKPANPSEKSDEKEAWQLQNKDSERVTRMKLKSVVMAVLFFKYTVWMYFTNRSKQQTQNIDL